MRKEAEGAATRREGGRREWQPGFSSRPNYSTEKWNIPLLPPADGRWGEPFDLVWERQPKSGRPGAALRESQPPCVPPPRRREAAGPMLGRAGSYGSQPAYRPQAWGRGAVGGAQGWSRGGALAPGGRCAACFFYEQKPRASRDCGERSGGPQTRAGNARAQLSWRPRPPGGRAQYGLAPRRTNAVETRTSEAPRPEVRSGRGGGKGRVAGGRRLGREGRAREPGTRGGHLSQGGGVPTARAPNLLALAWKSPHSFFFLVSHLRI